jgi:hypothetical protein
MGRAKFVSCLWEALKELENRENFNHLVETAAKRLVHTDRGVEMGIILCVDTLIGIRHLLGELPDMGLFIDGNLVLPSLEIRISFKSFRWPGAIFGR